MSAPPLLNAAGRRRSLVTLPGYLAGRPPRNKGLRYPPDPPTVEEIVAVMRQAGDGLQGARLRALIVLLGRAGLRINEALTLTERDLEPGAGSVLVRHGKGGRRREVGMDRWGWDHLRPGSSCASGCRSGRCCAWSRGAHAAGRGRSHVVHTVVGCLWRMLGAAPLAKSRPSPPQAARGS